MYDLLDLYALPYSEKYPVVCIDEKSKQLIEDSRVPISLKPGRPLKYDGEYRRMGTKNIFIAIEPKAGKRKIDVTDQRKKPDFAHFVSGLVLKDYQHAKKVIIILDNLNTHFPGSFYETFSKPEAQRILKRIEFHYTPKHGSWLNMAEIEINIMDRECLSRRIGSPEILKNEIKTWARKRNKERKKIYWTFTRQDADKKLSKYYVS